MSEETPGAESVPEGSGAGVDPVAVTLALGGADRDEANEFLRKQARLAELQAKELAHELELRHWSLLVRHLSSLLKLTFEVGLAMAGLALAAFVAAALWNAAHADGLVIESFSVPPDLAERGLSGQVIAGELLDRLTELNQATISSRTGRSYAANWGDDIKVEIPDTGVSVAEVYRFLRRWLGHESHISGAVWRNQNSIVITARTDGNSVTVSGPEADIDGQIRKAAEAVFGLADPYRYGAYLSIHGRVAEAIAVYQEHVASGSAADRSWALMGLARGHILKGDIGLREAQRLTRQAVLLDPGNSAALDNLAVSERVLSHLEAAVSDNRKLLELLGRSDSRDFGETSLAVVRQVTANEAGKLVGAYGDAIPSIANIIRSGTGGSFTSLSNNLAHTEIDAHDLKAARAITLDQDRKFLSPDAIAFDKIYISMDLATADQDWPGVLAAASSAEPFLKRYPNLRERFFVQFAPLQAYAEARLGHFSAAESLIATTPPDCDDCMLWRARIAEREGQHARADWWFARAVHDAPSIPLMYAAWGQALLERGQTDAAIAQFKIANQKGPHFADPLEGWGEALMAKNQSHMALVKFAEADKYTPNWGRLHLKWGEALYYSGHGGEAQKQFAQAAQLDLASAEKAELTRVSHG